MGVIVGSSLLSSWYFCRCTYSSGEETAAFLSILETLDNPENDPMLLALAYEELARTEIWMRIYALPDALNARRELSATNLPAFDAYLSGLLGILPANLAKEYRELLECVQKRAVTGEVRTRLQVCAGLLANLPMREPSKRPYLDMEEFLPEILVLAVTADRLTYDNAFAVSLDEMRATDQTLPHVLEEAEQGVFGRFAHILALRIDLSLGRLRERTQQVVIDRLWKEHEAGPDVMAITAAILFPASDEAFDATASVAAMKRESVILEELRKLPYERLFERVAEYVGSKNRDYDTPLSIIFWQVTLWERMAVLDPTAAANELSDLWNLPPGFTRINGTAPTENDRVRWIEQLASLTSLLDDQLIQFINPDPSSPEPKRNPPERQLAIVTGATANVPERCTLTVAKNARLFCSPWLYAYPEVTDFDPVVPGVNPVGSAEKIPAKERAKRDKPTGELGQYIAPLIRLLTCATIAVRILRHTAPDDPNRPLLAAIIAHAASVIAFIAPGKELRRFTRYFVVLDGYAEFAKRQIDLAGHGTLTAISPTDFLAIRDLTLDDHTEPFSRRWWLLFRNCELPTVFTGWIEDAYIGIRNVARDPTEGRWLPLLPKVWDLFPRAYDDQMLTVAALLCRYLMPLYILDIEIRGHRNALDWRRKKPRDLFHRVLLLTDKLSDPVEPDEWRKIDLDLYVPRAGRRTFDGGRGVEFVVSLERRMSLHSRARLSPAVEQVAEAWREDWLRPLRRISSRREFDRFIRLRLLELLNHDMLADDADAQQTIALTLLEYSDSQYEIGKLCEIVFPPDDAAVPSGARQGLRRILITAIVREVGLVERTADQRLNPQDPRRSSIVAWKRSFLDDILAKITLNNPSLRDDLGKLRQQILEEEAAAVPVISAPVEVRGDQVRIVLGDTRVPVVDWALRSAVRDQTMMTATLRVDDRGEGLWDPFTRLPPADNGPLQVLAIHVHGSDSVHVFNCGSFGHLEWPHPLVMESGTIVTLSLIRESDGRWEIADPPAVLESRTSLIECNISEERFGLPNRWFLTKDGVAINSRDLRDVWAADISRRFRGDSNEGPRPSWVTYCQRGTDLPVDRGLIDFLLDDSLREANVTVITVITRMTSAVGELSWRIATRPGVNYRIPHERFPVNDRLLLEQAAEAPGGCNGLLVAIAPQCDEDGIVRLHLVYGDHSIPKSMIDAYPGLVLPIDDRNRQWRLAFDVRDIVEIERDVNQNWKIVESPQIPGFAGDIAVVPSGTLGDDSRQQVSVVSWDPYEGSIQVAAIKSLLEVKPLNGWMDCLQRWFDAKPGDYVTIKLPVTSVDRYGRIGWLTDEGFKVFVDAESVTMDAIVPRQQLHLRPRTAQISYVGDWNWRPPVTVGQGSEIPASMPNRCEGMVVRIPALGTRHDIMWRTVDGVEQGFLDIDPNERLYPGDRIVGMRNGTSESWQFKVASRSLRARALWEGFAYEGEVRRHSLYLGDCLIKDEQQSVTEIAPGEFEHASLSEVGMRHLAKGGRGGLAPEFPANAVQREPGTDRYSLAYGAAKLYGEYRGPLPGNGNIAVGVQIIAEPRGRDKFLLRRIFTLTSAVAIPRNDDREKWEQYCANPRPLPVRFDRRNRTVHLANFRIPNGMGGWMERVPVPAAEQWFGVDDSAYSMEDGRVLILDHGGSPYPSFRRVPSLSPEGYQSHLQEPFDEQIELRRRLFYAGVETEDVLTGSRYDEPQHRFEWGYGWTLLVPQSQLRFGEGPFENAELALYYGDAITRISFLRGIPNAPGAGSVAIRIDAIQRTQYSSQTRDLYTQRTQNIVHILDLHGGRNDSTISISLVQGLNTNRLGTDDRPYDFNHVRATLTDESRASLALREGDIAHRIYGRLDAERFRMTQGKEIAFDHVCLSFVSSKDGIGTPLKDNELVFLRAGQIQTLRNEMLLHVGAIDGIDQRDVGTDAGRLAILRRDFAVRENALSRIVATSNENRLDGRVLLVRLSRKSDSRNPIQCSLREGIPARSPNALATLVRNSRTSVLATFERRADQGFRLEMNPGIFVILDLVHLVGNMIPSDVAPGSVVRIERAGEKYRITSASFSESRYIPDSTAARPVVALPKNFLASGQLPAFFDRQFTIGDLPNIDPMYLGDSRSFTDLMRRPHPKIVWLSKDERDTARINSYMPPGSDLEVGKLRWNPASLAVSFAPLNDGENRPLHWPLLSYRDGSARDLIDDLHMTGWQYHDTWTVQWQEGKGSVTPQIGRHTVASGPLVFEHGRRLRYHKARFRQLGLPVDALLAQLTAEPRSWRIADVNDKGDGLWLELAPGRLAEVPVGLLTAEDGMSLRTMHWDAFAPGDIVTLKLAPRNTLGIDTIAITEWVPGPRGAFRGTIAHLPVQHQDRNIDALTVGAGEFILTLPMVLPDDSSERVALSPDNDIRQDLSPVFENTVLLGLDVSGLPTIFAFPEYTVLPRKKEAHDLDDPFNDALIRNPKSGDCEGFDRNRLHAFITAAGGAVPVTVFHVNEQSKVIYVSRQELAARTGMPTGSICFGRVLGILDDKTALLRCGSGLLTAKIQELISGLPSVCARPAIDALRACNTTLWLRKSAAGIGSGITAHENTEVAVMAVTVVAMAGNGMSGLICQAIKSKRLYWLPQSHAAWTRLSAEQLAEHFFVEGRGKTFNVQYQSENRPVSVVDTPSARHEFASLEIGKRLTINLLPQTNGDGRARLGTSLATKIFLNYQHRGQADAGVGIQPAEVIARTFDPDTVTVIPIGTRYVILDLPAHLNRQLPSMSAGADKYRAKRDAHVEDWIEELDSPNPDLEILLCQAYGAYRANDTRDEVRRAGLRVAREWIGEYAKCEIVELAYAVRAIILLHIYGDSVAAVEWLRECGRRALRSTHVDIITTAWRFNRAYRQGNHPADELDVRLKRLDIIAAPDNEIDQPDSKIGVPVRQNWVDAAIEFCRAVELQPGSEPRYRALADALNAALGRLTSTAGDGSWQTETDKLIRIARTVPRTHGVAPLLRPWHIDELVEIIGSIDVQGVPTVSLLDPLPDLSYTTLPLSLRENAPIPGKRVDLNR